MLSNTKPQQHQQTHPHSTDAIFEVSHAERESCKLPCTPSAPPRKLEKN